MKLDVVRIYKEGFAPPIAWNASGGIHPIYIREGETYGQRIDREMSARNRPFIILEHDIAADPRALHGMDDLAAATQYERIIAAPYYLWDVRPRLAHRVRRAGALEWATLDDVEYDQVGFGAIYIPRSLWDRAWIGERVAWNGKAGQDYPVLDTTMSRAWETCGARMLRAPHEVVHLHFTL